MPDFLPRRDADLRAWLRVFAAGVAADYAALSLTLEQSEELTARLAAFESAYALAHDPTTRTRVAIAAKDQARDAATALARQFAAIIRAVPGIRDETLIGLGLRPRKPVRTPVSRPSSAPTLTLSAKSDGQLTVQLTDFATPTSRGMPRHVAQAAIFAHIGTAPPLDIRQWTFLRHTSRARTRIGLPPGAARGARVWLCARWLNRRGQAGPLGTAVETIADAFYTLAPTLRPAA